MYKTTSEVVGTPLTTTLHSPTIESSLTVYCIHLCAYKAASPPHLKDVLTLSLTSLSLSFSLSLTHTHTHTHSLSLSLSLSLPLPPSPPSPPSSVIIILTTLCSLASLANQMVLLSFFVGVVLVGVSHAYKIDWSTRTM